MIQKIRNNTFETNSSSIHSLAIVTSCTSKLLEDLKVDIVFGEFGWGDIKYTDSRDLLSYVWTAIHTTFDYAQSLEYIKLMKEWLPKCVFTTQGNFIDNGHYMYWDIPGYIDHGDLLDFLQDIFKDKEIFASFIFGGIIYISNDNQEIIYGVDECEKYEYHWEKGN